MNKREIYSKVYNHEITAEEAAKLLSGISEYSEFGLSENQKTLLISQMLYPDSSAYNLTIPIIIHENIVEEDIRLAGKKILRRHPMLNVRMILDESDYWSSKQAICEEENFLFEKLDLSDISFEEQKQQIVNLSKKKFNIFSDSMIRIYQIKLDDNKFMVLLVVHHIIADGASLAILARDFVYLLKQRKDSTKPDLPPVEGDYRKFIDWQQNFLKSPVARKMQKYWLEYIKIDNEKIDLPRKAELKSESDFRGHTIIEMLDGQALSDLRRMAHECNVSLYVLTLSAFYILLAKYSGQTELQIGSPMFGRPSAQFFNCVGYFSNIVVLNTEIDEEVLFEDYLKIVKESVHHAIDNSTYPLSAICKSINRQSPQLFTIAFAVQAFIKDMELDGNETEFGAKTTQEQELVDVLQQEGAFELFLEIQEGKSEAKLAFKYQKGVFEEKTIQNISSNYVWLLKNIVKDYSRKIGDLDCVCPNEKEFLLKKVNSFYDDIPSICVHRIIDEVAKKNPQKQAVVYKEKSISYLELCNFSTYVSNYLKEHGVKKGDVVGVFMDRCIEWIVAILGIFKTGAIYLPLDCKAPKERIKYIMEQTDMKTAFVDSLRFSMQNEFDTEFLVLEDILENASISKDVFTAWENVSELGDVAYIIYTSGTTGNPKGVQVWHGGFANSVNTLTNRPGVSSDERGIAIATMCFDMSLVETMPILCKGGTVEIIPSEVVENGINLARYLETCGGTFMSATPSTYKILYAAGFKNNSIQKAWVGGESLPSPMAEKMLNSFSEVWNIFGPTESSMLVSVYKIEDASRIEVGSPIGNHNIYVLDQRHNIVPIGAKGELFIGGKGIYKPCYFKDDKNNSEKFIEDKFGGGDYLYKSGDLVSIGNDGIMHFYCRLDGMVKFRGLRIELDEIDSTISKLEGVHSVATVIRKVGNNHKEIVSFIIFDNEQSYIGSDDIKNSIGSWIPKYMIPSNYYALEKLPLLVNLKINKKYLANAQIDEILEKYNGFSIEALTEDRKQDDVDDMFGLVIKDVKNIIYEIVTEDGAYNGANEINDEDVLDRLGFDSVRYVSFAIKINELYKIEMSPGALSNIQTVKQVAIFIINNYLEDVSKRYDGQLTVSKKRERNEKILQVTQNNAKSSDIAVIGIAYEFCGAKKDKDLLEILEKGQVPSFKVLNRDMCKELVGREAFYLNNIWAFDADYFNVNEKDAKIMYPELRKFYSLSAKALANAGLDPHNVKERDTGVFLGMGSDEYGCLLDEYGVKREGVYSKKEYIPMLLSRFYQFTNVSKMVDCSMASADSLVEACNAISNGQCKMALAGGSSILYTSRRFDELEYEGRNKKEDNKYGLVPGEGAVVLVLKSLENAIDDNDYIHLVIKDIKCCADVTSDIFPRKDNMLRLFDVVYGNHLNKKVITHEELGIGTKYCADVCNNVDQKYFEDLFKTNGKRSKSSRMIFGDVDAASVFLALTKIIVLNKQNKIKDDNYFAITEVGSKGKICHLLVQGYVNGNIEETIADNLFNEKVCYIPESGIGNRIQKSAPHILGLTRRGLPIERLLKYWGDTKNKRIPLPIGGTFLKDCLFDEQDDYSVAHMLVEIPSTGKKLEVIIIGNGEPLLLMPGFGLTVTQFIPQIMFLGLKCMMICIHPPGVGLSEPCEDVTFEAIAGCYYEALDIIGITRKVNILATSWGGVLAQFFAHIYPQRCNSLVLSNTSANLVINTHVGLKEMIYEDFAGINAEDALKMFNDATSIEERISYKYEEILASGKGKTIDFLDEIKVPSQIIAGGKDTLVTTDDMKQLHQKLSNSNFCIIESSGHASNLMCVEEFNNICVRFLKKNGVKPMNRLKHMMEIKKYILMEN